MRGKLTLIGRRPSGYSLLFVMVGTACLVQTLVLLFR
jgi:hypothetical protein